ncbi:hypothetical protein, partial [Butyricimonas paravirosa]|uniref:hypothetical protein n=1 Tax=Butyricimonas paravirosa TaxID=1472417 RepID=UPI00210C03C0
FFHVNIVKELFLSFSSPALFGAKADAKIRRFFVSFQIFFEVFSNFFSIVPFNGESNVKDRYQHRKNTA